jgi:hypothetical protein
MGWGPTPSFKVMIHEEGTGGYGPKVVRVTGIKVPITDSIT